MSAQLSLLAEEFTRQERPVRERPAAPAFVLAGDCLDVLRTMPAASIAAVVTDPPYGLSREPDMIEVLRHWLADGEAYRHRGGGFMGKSWDSFVPGPDVWREVLRVLKPGGHALVFSGTRTYDLTVLAMRIAGFEIRDQLAWLYGSGFPKSLDVSKAIDASDAVAVRLERARSFQAWLRPILTPQQVDASTASAMGYHYTTHPTQPCVATRAHLELLRLRVGVVPAWIEALVDERFVESDNMRAREVVDTRARPVRPGFSGSTYGVAENIDVATTLPHSPEAQRWSGWGTALKPAQEPIVLARKPLIGTVAANVLAHGTGGINVDACRIAGPPSQGGLGGDGLGYHGADGTRTIDRSMSAGRWPANVILDDVAAEILDEQSGERPVSGAARNGRPAQARDNGERVALHGGLHGNGTLHNDTGGASRFFYVAKTSRAEREAGLDHLPEVRRDDGRVTDHHVPNLRTTERRNHHPTVKPIALMRYLVRLITPPGGMVLDPYGGSGSTACAAVLEGFASTTVELTPEYIPLIEGRIEHCRDNAPDYEIEQ